MDFLNLILDTVFLVKLVFILLSIMLTVFGLFIFKQILNMSGIIDLGPSSSMLKSLAILNIIVVFCLILTALVIL